MTTASKDTKYVKNIAKEAEGLTETEINEIEVVSEEDLARFPEGVVVAPIIPEKPPTVEEIEQMEKVEVEEVEADANFPSNEGTTGSAIGAELEGSESDNQIDGSFEVSTSGEDDFESEELNQALKAFDEITISVEDIKIQQSESDEFRLIELPNESYEKIIEVYNKLQEDSNADVLDLLGEETRLKLLTQASKLGLNTSNMSEFKFFVEAFIREICGNAFMEKGKDLVDDTLKAISNSEESKEISKLLEDFIEESYYNRITRLNKMMDDPSATKEVVESAIIALNANEDAKTLQFISKALNKKPSYLNSWKAFKHQKRNANDIHEALKRIGIENTKVDVIMNAIGEFTSLEVESVNIFSIILEVLVKETNTSDKIQMMRLYSMLLFLSGALHVSKSNKVLNEFYTDIMYNFQRLCETISAGYKAYDLGARNLNKTPVEKSKKRRK